MLGAPRDAARRNRLLRLAAAQEALFSLRQARDLGVAPSALRRSIEQGWLRRVHRGVLSIGPPRRTPAARGWAAVLAVGPSGLVGGWAGAALLGLVPEIDGPVDVLVPGPGRPRGVPGVRVRLARLPLGPVLRAGGPPRIGHVWALHELSSRAGEARLREAVWRVLARGGGTARQVRASLDAHPGRRGNRRLRAALDAVADPGLPRTRADLEPRFLVLCRERGLPAPLVNAPVHGFEVDFLWHDQRLIVEVDGAHHARRDQRAKDRARDRRLGALGYTVMRVGWDDLAHDAGAVIGAVAHRLAAAPRPAPSPP